MKLLSTRDNQAVDALTAVIAGIAKSGGLFVPQTFPQVSEEEWVEWTALTYPELAAKVLGKYFDELSLDVLSKITRKAYASFDDERVAPLTELAPNQYVLELWHGPTLAFKDMALKVLPGLMAAAKQEKGETSHTMVLVATSGDTGKAALAGFQDAPGIDVTVFYPDEGVSPLQKLQMVTQEGENTHVFGVYGNFDDAQTGVKEIFANEEFAKWLQDKGYELSSANSINFGRLAPQIAYYFGAYLSLVRQGRILRGQAINFVVPTGNFGNILAAYYAKQMGLPVNKLICASNTNNVLTDFFHSGEYVSKREFYKTMSPSMDILISSNLERLLYEITGRDTDRVAQWMQTLKEKGSYTISEQERDVLQKDFYADWCSEEGTREQIRETYLEHHYLIDPHTAVGMRVYKEYVRQTGDDTVTVIASTANPYKFVSDVLQIFAPQTKGDVFEQADLLQLITGTPIPKNILELKDKPVRHQTSVAKEKMLDTVKGLIK